MSLLGSDVPGQYSPLATDGHRLGWEGRSSWPTRGWPLCVAVAGRLDRLGDSVLLQDAHGVDSGFGQHRDIELREATWRGVEDTVGAEDLPGVVA